MWQPAHPFDENGGGQRFADPAQGQRAERDAQLHGGQKIVHLLLQPADCAGTGHAGGQHLLDAGVADGNQGKLCGHKKCVGQNEHPYGDKSE